MTWYSFFLFVHITAAIVWLGGGLTTSILGARISRTDDAGRMAGFAHDVAWIGMRVFTPASLIVLVFGFLLVHQGDWGYDRLWIQLGLVGIVLTALTGMLFLGPESGRIGALIDREGGGSQAVRSRIARILFVSRIDLGVIFAVAADMALKPDSGDVGALVLIAAIPVLATITAVALYRGDIRAGAGGPVAAN